MNARTRYFANTPRRPRTTPGDPAFPCGIHRDRSGGLPIGTAFPYAQVGGAGLDSEPGETNGPPEVVWRLVIGKEELEDRFVLRDGEFAGLAEDAV